MGHHKLRNRDHDGDGGWQVSVQDWAALAVSLLTIASAFVAVTRWLVKHYLAELKPNGGKLDERSNDKS